MADWQDEFREWRGPLENNSSGADLISQRLA